MHDVGYNVYQPNVKYTNVGLIQLKCGYVFYEYTFPKKKRGKSSFWV